MPLSDSRRQQLDGIVVKLGQQNAPKDHVQTIVNDFKSKYENENTPTSKPGFFQNGGGLESAINTGGKIADATVGKVANTVFGTAPQLAADFGGTAVESAKSLITGKPNNGVFTKSLNERTSSLGKIIGNVGGVALDALNFVGGGEAEGAVKSVGKKIVEDVGEKVPGYLRKAAPWFKGGAAYGGLSEASKSLQGGQSLENTAINTLKGSAVGAGTGLILPLAIGGGAKFLGSVKNLVSPDVENALMQAIKPKANNTAFKESLKLALPDILETAQHNNMNIENIDHLDDAISQSKKRVWENYKQLLGPNKDATVDGNKIADAMVSNMNKRFIAQNPQKAEQIIQMANTYRKPINLNDMEEYLQSANNELHSYYAKNKVNQSVAAADPEVGHVLQEADALRKELNGKLNELTGKDAAELKRRYGALSNIQKEVIPRKNVIARQNPESISDQLNVGRGAGKILKSVANFQIGDALEGAGEIAASKFLKGRNDPNNLIKGAFESFAKNPELNKVPNPNKVSDLFGGVGKLSQNKVVSTGAAFNGIRNLRGVGKAGIGAVENALSSN